MPAPTRPPGLLTRDRLASRSRVGALAGPLGRAVGELALVLVLFGLYRWGRHLAAGHEVVALEHASLVRAIQSHLPLPSEAALQARIDSEVVFAALNHYYVSVHFPLMVAFLLWGYLRRPRQEYRWARTLVALQTGAALVIHVVFPLAPPRMFPEWGFVDTMTRYGPSAYDGASAAMANQFAAMPSLHVGWAVLIAYVVARTGPRWLAVLAGLHAAVTTAVVILTANHWWLDGFVSVGLLVLAARVCRSSRLLVPPSGLVLLPIGSRAGR